MNFKTNDELYVKRDRNGNKTYYAKAFGEWTEISAEVYRFLCSNERHMRYLGKKEECRMEEDDSFFDSQRGLYGETRTPEEIYCEKETMEALSNSLTGEEKEILEKLLEDPGSKKEVAEALSLSTDMLRRRLEAIKEKVKPADHKKETAAELPLFLTLKELTQMLKVSERTARRLMEQEGLPHFCLRGRLFVNSERFYLWMKRYRGKKGMKLGQITVSGKRQRFSHWEELPDVLSCKEISSCLNTSEPFVYELLKDGTLPGIYEGKKVVVDRDIFFQVVRELERGKVED